MPSKLTQDLAANLRRLRGQQEPSEGRVPARAMGGTERFLKGGLAELTAPLALIGQNYEPDFGETGPGAAGIAGSLVGALFPYAGAELALAKAIPLLRSGDILTRTARTSLAFGAVDAAREPLPGETRVDQAIRGAITGGAFGALIPPGAGPIRAGLGGGAAALAPMAIGEQPHSPFEITGHQTLDAVLFNSLLVGGLHALRLRPQEPKPNMPASEPTVADAAGTGPAPAGSGPLAGGTGASPNAPLTITELTVASGPVATVKTPEKVTIKQLTRVKKPAVAAVPTTAPELVRPPAVAIAAETTPPTPEMDTFRRWDATKPAPTIEEMVKQQIEAPAVVSPVPPIEVPKTKSERVKAAADSINRRVGKGQPIAISQEEAAKLVEAGAPGVDFHSDSATGATYSTINTTGMDATDLNRLIKAALTLEPPNRTLMMKMRGTLAGLTAGRGRKRTPEEVIAAIEKERIRRTERPTSAIGLSDKGRLGELQPEPGAQSVEVLKGEPVGVLVDRALDMEVAKSGPLAEQVMAEEANSIVRGLKAQTAKKDSTFREHGIVRQGSSSAGKSYGETIRLLKERKIVPVASDQPGKTKLIFPDKTTRDVTVEEMAAILAEQMPETKAVPVYNGPDKPPLDQAIVPPPTPEVAKPNNVPEPAADIVLKDAVLNSTEVISVEEPPGRPIDALVIPFRGRAKTTPEEQAAIDRLNKLGESRGITVVKVDPDPDILSQIGNISPSEKHHWLQPGYRVYDPDPRYGVITHDTLFSAEQQITREKPPPKFRAGDQVRMKESEPEIDALANLTDTKFQQEMGKEIAKRADPSHANSLFESAVDNPTKLGQIGRTPTAKAIELDPRLADRPATSDIPIYYDKTLTAADMQKFDLLRRFQRVFDILPNAITQDIKALYLTYQPKHLNAGEHTLNRMVINVGGADNPTDALKAIIHELVHSAEAAKPGMLDALSMKLGWKKVSESEAALHKLRIDTHRMMPELGPAPVSVAKLRGQWWVLDNPAKPDMYMYKNPREHIAEAYEMFARDPDALKALDFNTYKAIAESEHLVPFYVKGHTLPEASGQYRLLYAREKFGSPSEAHAKLRPPTEPEPLTSPDQQTSFDFSEGISPVERTGKGEEPTHITKVPEPLMSAEQAPITITGLEKVVEATPKQAQIDVVKDAGQSKQIHVQQDGEGITIEDKIAGTKVRVKTAKEAAKVIAENENNTGFVVKAEQLRSWFRRRFAGAKTPIERNRLHEKYKHHEAYFPPAGFRLAAGEVPLESKSPEWMKVKGRLSRRKGFVVDLTPEGAPGGIALPPGSGPSAPSQGETPSSTIADLTDINGMGISGYIRIAKTWMQDLEMRTFGRLAAYTKIYEPLYDGHQNMRREMDPFLAKATKVYRLVNGSDRRLEALGAYLEAPDKSAAEVRLGLNQNDIEAAKVLRQLYDEGFKTYGYVDEFGSPLKAVEYLENYLPHRRANETLTGEQMVKMMMQGGRVVRPSYKVFSEYERTGEMPVHLREFNALKLYMDWLYSNAKKKHLAGPHQAALDYISTIKYSSDQKPIMKHLENFIDGAWGTTDHSRNALNVFTKKFLHKLGVKLSPNADVDLVNMLMQLNVGSLIAWRVPLVLRNTFQVSFAYPFLGERYFQHGLTGSLTKEGHARAVKAGVIEVESLPFGDEIFNPFSRVTQFVKAGTRPYGRVDKWTRVVAFLGMEQKVLDAGMRYRAGKIDLEGFAIEAELSSTLHPVEVNIIKKTAQSGNIPKAAELAGRYLSENTNWIYWSGNQPAAFKGVVGRLFGQFGMWPVSYIEYVRSLFTYGTKEQRALKGARWLAVNSAFTGAGAALGVDTMKWVFFGPLVFTGGPIVQALQDVGVVAQAQVQGKEDDPMSALALSRVKRMPLMFVPGAGLARDAMQSYEQAQRRGMGAGLTRLLTGQVPDIPFRGGLGLMQPQSPSQPGRQANPQDAARAKRLQDALNRRR